MALATARRGQRSFLVRDFDRDPPRECTTIEAARAAKAGRDFAAAAIVKPAVYSRLRKARGRYLPISTATWQRRDRTSLLAEFRSGTVAIPRQYRP